MAMVQIMLMMQISMPLWDSEKKIPTMYFSSSIGDLDSSQKWSNTVIE